MKKLSKSKRVPDGKRFSVVTDRMDRCYICGAFSGLQKHEIFGGMGKRELSKYYGLVVPLCVKCHDDVHKKKDIAIPMKQVGQKAFEKHYPNEDFADVFGRNYL